MSFNSQFLFDSNGEWLTQKYQGLDEISSAYGRAHKNTVCLIQFKYGPTDS